MLSTSAFDRGSVTLFAHLELVSCEALVGGGRGAHGAREQVDGTAVVGVLDLHLGPLAPHVAQVVRIHELGLHTQQLVCLDGQYTERLVIDDAGRKCAGTPASELAASCTHA